MAHEDRGHYAKKHPENSSIDPAIAEAVNKKAPGEKITCAAAFRIVEDMNSSPAEVGLTMDILEKRLTKCQLGLFGYEPGKKAVKPLQNVPPELEKAIEAEVKNNRISCRTAWSIAESLGLKKMYVSSACDTLGVKVSPCQLGAFKRGTS